MPNRARILAEITSLRVGSDEHAVLAVVLPSDQPGEEDLRRMQATGRQQVAEISEIGVLTQQFSELADFQAELCLSLMHRAP